MILSSPLAARAWSPAAPETSASTDADTISARAPLPAESVAMALRLNEPRLVQRVLLMLVDEHPPVPPDVLAPLTAHPNLEVRLTAVAVLSRWTDSQSRQTLMQFLKDPSPVVRDRVLQAIEGSGGRWTPVSASAILHAENDPALARRLAEAVVRDVPLMAPRILQRAAALLVSSRRFGAVLSELLRVLRGVDESMWQRLVSHVPPRFLSDPSPDLADAAGAAPHVTDHT
jgi:HEAT repeat protein